MAGCSISVAFSSKVDSEYQVHQPLWGIPVLSDKVGFWCLSCWFPNVKALCICHPYCPWGLLFLFFFLFIKVLFSLTSYLSPFSSALHHILALLFALHSEESNCCTRKCFSCQTLTGNVIVRTLHRARKSGLPSFGLPSSKKEPSEGATRVSEVLRSWNTLVFAVVKSRGPFKAKFQSAHWSLNIFLLFNVFFPWVFFFSTSTRCCLYLQCFCHEAV